MMDNACPPQGATGSPYTVPASRWFTVVQWPWLIVASLATDCTGLPAIGFGAMLALLVIGLRQGHAAHTTLRDSHVEIWRQQLLMALRLDELERRCRGGRP